MCVPACPRECVLLWLWPSFVSFLSFALLVGVCFLLVSSCRCGSLSCQGCGAACCCGYAHEERPGNERIRTMFLARRHSTRAVAHRTRSTRKQSTIGPTHSRYQTKHAIPAYQHARRYYEYSVASVLDVSPSAWSGAEAAAAAILVSASQPGEVANAPGDATRARFCGRRTLAVGCASTPRGGSASVGTLPPELAAAYTPGLAAATRSG